MNNFWLWLTGIDEHYSKKMFIKEFLFIALTSILIALILVFAYYND